MLLDAFRALVSDLEKPQGIERSHTCKEICTITAIEPDEYYDPHNYCSLHVPEVFS